MIQKFHSFGFHYFDQSVCFIKEKHVFGNKVYLDYEKRNKVVYLNKEDEPLSDQKNFKFIHTLSNFLMPTNPNSFYMNVVVYEKEGKIYFSYDKIQIKDNFELRDQNLYYLCDL